MYKEGLSKFFYGCLFVFFSFRIKGVDILPDIIGYILFASGFSSLANVNDFFNKGKNYNIIMIFLSIFSIYKPQQSQGAFYPVGINFLILAVSIAALVLYLLVMYNMLMGIGEIAISLNLYDLKVEADERWKNIVWLQIAVLFAFFLALVPPIGFVYIIVLAIVAIVIAVKLMKYIKRCQDAF